MNAFLVFKLGFKVSGPLFLDRRLGISLLRKLEIMA